MTREPPDDELEESRLYTFIDADRAHALYFVEGQRLIRDLALVHGVKGAGFAWFRDCVLQVLPLIALVKRGEQVGFYIDSEQPLVRLKIETNHAGDLRGAMFPDELPEVPEKVRGKVRVQTLYPDGRQPYLSVIEVRDLALRAIVDRVLLESHQVQCALALSETSDQSAMLHLLPPLPGEDAAEYSREAVLAARDALLPGLRPLFARALLEPRAIEAAFASLGWRLLASRPVRFRCSCSHERMVRNLRLVRETEGLFGPGEPTLEVTCDYCRQRYLVRRQELESGDDLPH